MGTPDFARESLKAIYEAGHNILAVVTNPDKPKGRGMKMVASPVKEFALEKGLTVYQPEKVRKNEEFIEKIKNGKGDEADMTNASRIINREIRKQRKAGLEQGFKQGTIQIAKKLKREMSIKDISRITGLTEQEIENL